MRIRRNSSHNRERAFFEFRLGLNLVRVSLVLTMAPHYVEQWAILHRNHVWHGYGIRLLF